MSKQEEYIAKIPKYLDGALPSDQKDDFDAYLAKHPTFQEHIDAELATRNFVKLAQRKRLYDKFDQWEEKYEQKTQQRSLWILAAVAASVLLFAIFLSDLILPSAETLDQMAMRQSGQIVVKDIISEERDRGELPSEIEKAIRQAKGFYEVGACAGTRELAKNHKGVTRLNVIHTLCLIQQGKYVEAQALIDVPNPNYAFEDRIPYFQALIYLKQKNSQKACEVLAILANSKNIASVDYPKFARELLKGLSCP